MSFTDLEGARQDMQGRRLYDMSAVPGALYIGELLGALLMFAGFIRATTPRSE